jgi:hypothetical protein
MQGIPGAWLITFLDSIALSTKKEDSGAGFYFFNLYDLKALTLGPSCPAQSLFISWT